MTNKLATLTVMIVIGLVLAGCGSGSDNVASLRTTENNPAAGLTPNAADGVLDEEAKVMTFTQCMRDKGMEFKDPVVDSEGNVQKPQLLEGFEYDVYELKAAYVTCGPLIEGVAFGLKKVDLSQQVDLYVALAACLRDKGFDIDDPTAENLKTWMTEFKTILDWNDPKVLAAYETCSGGSSGSKAGNGK